MADLTNTRRYRCGAFIIRDGKILLIKRIKPDRTYWVFPGGGKRPGETEEECTRREVYEEVGLKADKVEFGVSLKNDANERSESYFLVKAGDGEPQMTGEEKDRNTPDNQYILEWHDPSFLDNENLYPEHARKWLKKYLEENRDEN